MIGGRYVTIAQLLYNLRLSHRTASRELTYSFQTSSGRSVYRADTCAAASDTTKSPIFYSISISITNISAHSSTYANKG